MLNLFSLFCRHEWQTVIQEKTKTQLDVLRSNGSVIPVPANDHQTDKMTRYKHIDIFTCKKCGALKRFITKSD